jgi:hypothetical protein
MTVMALAEQTGEHEIQPNPRIIRSINPRFAGRPTDGMDATLYPLRGLCLVCGRPVRIQTYFLGSWVHVEGDSPPVP